MLSFLRFPTAVLSLVLVTMAPSRAPAQMAPGAMAERFQAVANERRADRISSSLASNARLQARIRRQTRERLVATLSALAIATIAQAPHRRREVIGAATAAAPEVAAEVRYRIAAAYPAPTDRRGAWSTGRTRTEPPSSRAQVAVGPAPARRFATRADTTFARAIRNPALAANRRRRADLDYAATLEAWLIASIARDPASLEVAVGQAVTAYPAGREALAQAAGRAYPGYATRITAAAGSGRSPDTRAVPVTGWTVATVPDEAESEPPPRQAVGVEEVWDPLEPLNRTIHSVNDVIDTVIVRPLAWTYNTLAPDLVIEAVRKFFDNLRAPVIFANDLLQLSFRDAAVTFGRFGVNSTVGVLGFFDPATAFGLEAHNADFGQTLHSYGTGPGPYIVLPLVGPSTVRDGIGMVVDIFFQPLTYFLTGEQALAVRGVNGIVTREELLEPLDELRASSVDYYSALQSAYYQRRAIELSKGLPGAIVRGEDADRLFDEAE